MTGLSSHFFRESDEDYRRHARAGHLGSHALADFRRAPILLYRKEMGIILDQDSAAYAFGRAAHTYILEGSDAFYERYVVGGPINPKTGAEFGRNTKAWAEWEAEHGKPVISSEDRYTIEKMSPLCGLNNSHARALLDDGIPEATLRAAYCGEPCQIRVDWLNEDYGLVDLKTCDNLDWFEANARRYGYIHQLAFYRGVTKAATGTTCPCFIIAVEKAEPFRCGVWHLSTDALDAATAQNEEALARLRECRDTEVWPTGFEAMRVLDFAS